MKVTLDAANKLFVLFVIQTTVVIVALGFLVWRQWDATVTAANEAKDATRISVNTTQCALTEILDATQAVAEDLGIPVVIVRPDVSHLNCEKLLNSEGASDEG